MELNSRLSTIVQHAIGICLGAFMFAAPMRAQVVASGRLQIDLRSVALNGRPLSQWTLDEITDSLGRPTAVTNGIKGISGPQLHYHPSGISLWFQAREKDPSQHLWIITVNMARNWDSAHSLWYEVFKGSMVPAVTANWKQSQLLEEFADLKPSNKSAEESKQEAQASGLTRLGIRPATNDFVHITIGKNRITFALEPNTSFLERVILRAAEIP